MKKITLPSERWHFVSPGTDELHIQEMTNRALCGLNLPASTIRKDSRTMLRNDVCKVCIAALPKTETGGAA